MFSRRSNASKIALAHLMARLYYGNFNLLDAQFTNDHLLQFGLIEVPKQEFQKQLQTALAHPAELPMDSEPEIIFAHLAQAKTVTSERECTRPENAGLEANIHPEKTTDASSSVSV